MSKGKEKLKQRVTMIATGIAMGINKAIDYVHDKYVTYICPNKKQP